MTTHLTTCSLESANNIWELTKQLKRNDKPFQLFNIRASLLTAIFYNCDLTTSITNE